MHILGLCNGSIHGNSEILLKAALTAAAASDPSITTSWIHVPSVAIPRNPKPLEADNSIIPESDERDQPIHKDTELDDRRAVLGAIKDADALIVATPVYSHQPPATLKALSDYILGPYADNSSSFRSLARNAAGDLEFDGADADAAPVDPRDVKPRVAGFLAVCGSNTPFPEQWTMALPTMHILTYPLHAKVVDQVVLPGNANAGAVLLEPLRTVDRARLLGERVASQVGKAYDEAEYLGEEEKGSCPYCHMLKIQFRGGNRVQCVVCGALGQLQVDGEGDIRPSWERDSDVSCMTLKGKWKHIDDIKVQLDSERPRLHTVAREREHWRNVHIPVVDMPSLRHDARLAAALARSHI
ncbi:Oxidoreductase [Coniochaeta hoffmannii]|uniref:Oxidoreductase n=1 Tax=Coniochaeta hoffmannii TaxID=91930 RepID=A0AA38R621_9PEZI|nr:Oxidoreductase [Coniochaeta hoffmannii]